MSWPREIAGHVIDRTIDPGYGEDAIEYTCIECGEVFDEEPDEGTLGRIPCEPGVIKSELPDDIIGG